MHATGVWILHAKLDDDLDVINLEEEMKRCASFDFGFPNATMMPLKRRRLFYGALISDDSAECRPGLLQLQPLVTPMKNTASRLLRRVLARIVGVAACIPGRTTVSDCVAVCWPGWLAL